MADKKKIIISISLLILLTCFFLIPFNIPVYIGIGNPSDDIDVHVKIDDITVFNDTLAYHPYNYIKIDKRLKNGFHTIEVSSDKIKLTETKRLFVLMNRYIVIQYFPKEMNEKAVLCIEAYSVPFYYE